MSAIARGAFALALLLSVSCASPLEEAGGFQPSPRVAQVPHGGSVLTVGRIPGEQPLDVGEPEFAQVIRKLSSQLGSVAGDPDLARRRMLALEPSPELEGVLLDGVLGGAAEGRIVLASADLTEAQNRALTGYGKRMGQQTLRLVVMLVASAIGEQGVGNLPRLPKFNVASQRLAAATGGQGLEVVAEVQQASVAGSKVTVVLAKATEAAKAGAAAATAAMAGGKGGGRRQCSEEDHHIATVENDISTQRGGPRTPRFRDLFDQVGLSIQDPANIARVWGHRGPHPEEYHQLVYRRLKQVLDRCGGGSACRAAFIRELERLGREIAMPGTRLNELVTQGCGKR